MSKFSQILKGTRAVHVVKLPLDNGEEIAVGVRMLLGRELGDVLGLAREYAVSKGLKDPKDGDRLYELGQMAYTLAIACVDPACAATDAPKDAAQAPFFDSADEILDNLDPDRIVFLYEQQQAWQDKCALRPDTIGQGDFFAKVLELAGWKDGEPDPLVQWRPTLRMSFAHTLAVQYMSLLTDRSQPTSDSAEPPQGS